MCWNVLDVLEGFGGCVPSQVPMADRPDALERVPLQPVEVCVLFFSKPRSVCGRPFQEMIGIVWKCTEICFEEDTP